MERIYQQKIEVAKSETKRTKMIPTSFPGTRFFWFEIDKKSPRYRKSHTRNIVVQMTAALNKTLTGPLFRP